MKLLVRAPNWVGDCVLATAVLARLRQRLPEASLEVWVRPALAPLFSSLAGCHVECHTLPSGRGLAALHATATAMRASRADAALLLAPSLRAGLEATLAGIPIRLGYPDDHRRALLTHPVAREGRRPVRQARAARAPFTRHILEEGLELADRLAELLGAAPPERETAGSPGGPGSAQAGSRPMPWIQPPQQAWDEAQSVTARIHPRADRPLIGINPTSRGGATRSWPLERYAALIQALRVRFDPDLVLFGGPEEGALVQQLVRRLEQPGSQVAGRPADHRTQHPAALLNRPVDPMAHGCSSARDTGETAFQGRLSVLAGAEALPLLTFAALAPRLTVLVTNDTGPMHLAAAMGARVIGIFGSTLPELTGPVGEGHFLLHRAELACAGCYRRSCPYGLECLTGITVEQVQEAIARCLEEAPRTPPMPGFTAPDARELEEESLSDR